jgi:hypothetical protein
MRSAHGRFSASPSYTFLSSAATNACCCAVMPPCVSCVCRHVRECVRVCARVGAHVRGHGAPPQGCTRLPQPAPLAHRARTPLTEHAHTHLGAQRVVVGEARAIKLLLQPVHPLAHTNLRMRAAQCVQRRRVRCAMALCRAQAGNGACGQPHTQAHGRSTPQRAGATACTPARRAQTRGARCRGKSGRGRACCGSAGCPWSQAPACCRGACVVRGVVCGATNAHACNVCVCARARACVRVCVGCVCVCVGGCGVCGHIQATQAAGWGSVQAAAPASTAPRLRSTAARHTHAAPRARTWSRRLMSSHMCRDSRLNGAMKVPGSRPSAARASNAARGGGTAAHGGGTAAGSRRRASE